MDIRETIRTYAALPLTHQILLSILKDYKRPNDKISTLIEQGFLIPIKKGLYIIGPTFNSRKPNPFTIANHISGPSYVSIDSALSHHGLIPERVYETSSVTIKISRLFTTPVGVFSYTRLPLPYYSFGIQRLAYTDKEHILIASPEKALFDKIVTTKSLILRSKISTINYLLEDLRMDEYDLKKMDTKTMQEWLPHAPKQESLFHVIKTLNSLQSLRLANPEN